MAALVTAGVNLTTLAPIRTQLQLLDLYWSYRVIAFEVDHTGDVREALLRRVCEIMVRTRTLRIDRSLVASTEFGPAVSQLLSSQILIEWRSSPTAAPERSIVTFGHHVLFDYAVARLLLRQPQPGISEVFREEPDLVLVIRPSVLLHFHHLWDLDSTRATFWTTALPLLLTSIPEVGKLIGPSVAAQLASSISDLQPLLDALEVPTPSRSCCRSRSSPYRYVSHRRHAHAPASSRPDAGPWCHFLEYASQHIRAAIAYPIRSMLLDVCTHPEILDSDQTASAGLTARRLLDFAWTFTQRDPWLVAHSLQLVCRTFKSDLLASASLLRRAIEPLHIQAYGFEELPWLAREVTRLIPLDPILVRDIFVAAFEHREPSEALTPLGGSRILPMTSTRKQDHHMALYELSEAFPSFLSHSPLHAIAALTGVLEAYVQQTHSPRADIAIEEKSFAFAGRQARFRTDYSAIWDSGRAYRHDEPLKMLDNFESYLEAQAQASDDDIMRAIVDAVVESNRLAAVWRRLLDVGSKFPLTLGTLLLPLGSALPILTGFDTITSAGRFIHAVHPILDPAHREELEAALLSIPGDFPSDQHDAAEHIRNQLLGQLAEPDLVSTPARRLLLTLVAANAIPPNDPPIHVGEFVRGQSGETEYLAGLGVPVADPPNRNIRELEAPVRQFADSHRNTIPSLDDINTVLPALRSLRAALSRADEDGVHPQQQDHGWLTLAEAAARGARADNLSCEEMAGQFIRIVLVEAGRHHAPRPHDDPTHQFDESPFWGPAARIAGAEGLALLARHPICVTELLLADINRLSSNPFHRYGIKSPPY